MNRQQRPAARRRELIYHQTYLGLRSVKNDPDPCNVPEPITLIEIQLEESPTEEIPTLDLDEGDEGETTLRIPFLDSAYV